MVVVVVTTADVVAVVEEVVADVAVSEEPVAEVPAVEEVVAEVEVVEEPAAEAGEEIPKPVAAPVASPSVRRLARELGIDLSKVRGSEAGGRIVTGDIRVHQTGHFKYGGGHRDGAAPARYILSSTFGARKSQGLGFQSVTHKEQRTQTQADQ